jgi:hypothetical protein
MKPLILSANHINQVLRHETVQVRRVIKPHPTRRIIKGDDGAWYDADGVLPGIAITCPFGRTGNEFYVKETWTESHSYDGKRHFAYKASGEVHQDFKWRSPSTMPREASRITLTLHWATADRLQSLLRTDAMEEGFHDTATVGDDVIFSKRPEDQFRENWNKTHKSAPWESNPWVWTGRFYIPAWGFCVPACA